MASQPSTSQPSTSQPSTSEQSTSQPSTSRRITSPLPGWPRPIDPTPFDPKPLSPPPPSPKPVSPIPSYTTGLGFGTRGVTDPDWVREAIICGYRHFDCAYLYENEAIIGQGIKKCIDEGLIKRSELYITSKLPMNGMAKGKVTHFLDKSLKALGVDYLDLYLIHSPICVKHKGDHNFYPVKSKTGLLHLDKKTKFTSTWKKLEKAVDNGKVKCIGISNFNEEQIKTLLAHCRIKPTVIQAETHIYFQQKSFKSFCDKSGLVYESYAPLGSVKLYEEAGITPIIHDPVINQLARKYEVTPAQLALRWHHHLNMIPVVGFDNVSQIKENINIRHFGIYPEDLAIIEQLDRNERKFYLDQIPGARLHRFYPF